MSIKILVVDDEEDVELLMQQRFRRKIAEGAWQLTYANSGKNALHIIQSQPDFDVLLLDINMPEMDGLTLLGEIETLLLHGRAVIVSAYSDMDNIRTAMNRGAFDFVCKPINFTDLEATIDKTVKHVRELKQLKHDKEVHYLRTRFFDNITHEFRTPLTLILSPIEKLLQYSHWEEHAKSDLYAIDRNTRHLLRLINQLLELARLEAGFRNVQEQAGELHVFIEQIVQAFHPYARQQEVALQYHSTLSGAWLYDEDKLGQIVYNLISNAIKFSRQVTVALKEEAEIQLIVSDNGAGISEQHLPYVFDRFYQGTSLPGSGIGLSLVKELVMLMEGRVTVDSKPTGTSFTIHLPLKKAEQVAAAKEEKAAFWDWFPQQVYAPATPLPGNGDYLILLVEDNEELATYITHCLTPHYRLLVANNAEQAWQLVQEELPDVVISDLMLPGMDGYALTQCIKTAAATDHIAVILLTAKAGYDNRLQGLQQGADDYLTKPFHVEELLLRLHNLLTRQQRLREFYTQQLSQPGLPQQTDGWLKEVYSVLDAHLDDPILNVEWLATKMAMSRKTLLRKVQALTKLSPNELIRNYRLRKAADLLRAGHTVSETAYSVGFETPAYFGQCFKELFHITPGRFIESSVNGRE